MSTRIDKVNQQLKREIGDILMRELGDPRLQFVTITHAQVSKDLRHAKVYYSVLGDAQQLKLAEKGLNGAKGIIRKYVASRMEMRYIPELMFVYDKTLELSARIDEALKEIHDESKENPSSD